MNSNKNLRANLRCIECSAEYSIYGVRYLCEKCGGLLEVSHDVDALKQAASAEQWKELFAKRVGASLSPFSSGIWCHHELVLPQIAPEHIVTLGEGNSPLVSLGQLSRELGLKDVFLKNCGVSHTGSFKDLGMTVLVSHVVSLKARGVPIRAVACASTGDTSAALSAYAAAAGIPTIVFLPEGKITAGQLVQPQANGALVLSLKTDFDGCMRIVKEISKDSTLYLANSMNPLRIEGQKSISFEICRQLNWEVPDWIIIPGGNLGNVSALGSGLLMLQKLGLIDRLPRICVAQSKNANPLYLSFKNDFTKFEPVVATETLASAIRIGNPVSYPRAVRTLRQFNGVVEQADEQELAEAAARVDRQGMFNCPHTGVALAALFKLTASGKIKSGERVVVISTAHGLKFNEFKSGYHTGELKNVAVEQSEYRNEFITLEPEVEIIQKVLSEMV